MKTNQISKQSGQKRVISILMIGEIAILRFRLSRICIFADIRYIYERHNVVQSSVCFAVRTDSQTID